MSTHPQTPRFRNIAQESEGGWAINQLCDLLNVQYTQTEAALAELADVAPRVVTTLEEMDEMPEGSVVLSQSYHLGYGFEQCSFQKYDDMWFRGRRRRDTHPDFFLPATVLHEPTTNPTR